MLEFDASGIGLFLKEKINRYTYEPKIYEYGTVASCADGIVQVSGLSHSRYGELLEFENDSYGLALHLRLDGVGAVLLSGASEVASGSIVRGTGHVADIGVGEALLGRVVDRIGRALDGEELVVDKYRPIESPAPTIMQRAPVDTPMETGLLAIDSMIPIGRGQRAHHRRPADGQDEHCAFGHAKPEGQGRCLRILLDWAEGLDDCAAGAHAGAGGGNGAHGGCGLYGQRQRGHAVHRALRGLRHCRALHV